MKFIFLMTSQNGKKIFINENCKGGTEIVNLKITEGRYVKFHFIKRKTQYGFSLWDVFFI